MQALLLPPPTHPRSAMWRLMLPGASSSGAFLCPLFPSCLRPYVVAAGRLSTVDCTRRSCGPLPSPPPPAPAEGLRLRAERTSAASESFSPPSSAACTRCSPSMRCTSSWLLSSSFSSACASTSSSPSSSAWSPSAAAPPASASVPSGWEGSNEGQHHLARELVYGGGHPALPLRGLRTGVHTCSDW